MAMDALAAAAAGIPLGRVVSLAAFLVFLLGASWLAIFRSILRSAEHCLAVEGSVWGDEECLLSIQYMSTVVAVSLTMMLALRYGAAAVGKGAVATGGARDGRPDRERGSASAEAELAHSIAFFHVYLLCAAIILAGKMAHHAGARRLLEEPADEGAASLVKSGPIYTNVGFLALYVQNSCFVIPYWLLRLMRFLRENCVGSPKA